MKAKYRKVSTTIIGVLVMVTAMIGTVLTSMRAKASNSSVDQVTVTIQSACTLSGSIKTEHTAIVVSGSYTSEIGTTNLKVLCNDFEGFAIYAIGYTGDVEGTTTMVGTNTGATIGTGTATSGGTSNWAMKLTKVTNPGGGAPDVTYGADNLTITSGYSGYHAVPSNYTKVATYKAASGSSATDSILGSNIETTYAAFVTSGQVADTYVGQVKYLLVHPASIDWISSNGITAVFQAYPGSSISFADGSSTNKMVFRIVCDENDNCTFMVTDGEYKEPIGYKGAWVVPMPDGSGGYDMQVFEIQDGANEWINGLNNLGGGAFLGQEVPIYAYNGDAIIYDGNNATDGDMDHVASRFTNGEATLIAPNFYKTGYGFAGWSTSSSATPTNGATIYGPNETVSESSFSYDENDNVTLYATWVQSTGNMQNFSCSSLNQGSITALTDSRDGNVYTVGRLADGNCWMMENLRLKGYTEMNSTNTNSPAISKLGSSQDSWCTGSSSSCIDQSIINTNNTAYGGTNSQGDVLIPYYTNYVNNEQWYAYGNYYNWYAATAGNGTYSVDSSSTVLDGDICPAGWHLPSGYSNGEFAGLSVALGGLNGSMSSSTTPTGTVASGYFRSYPNNFIYSGYWDGSSAVDRSNVGNYWSRTANYSDTAYNFYLDSGYVYPGTYVWDKYDGFSVRCLQSGS